MRCRGEIWFVSSPGVCSTCGYGVVGIDWVRWRACQSSQFTKFKLTQSAIKEIIRQNEGLLFWVRFRMLWWLQRELILM